MSEKEAEEAKEIYFQALKAIFGFTDDLIRFTSGGHAEVEIWSTIDDDDVGVIVNTRLQAARVSARAANSVRRTIYAYQQIAIYIIVGPRVWQTLQHYSEFGLDIPIKFRRKRRMRVVHEQGYQTSAHRPTGD